MFDWLFEKEVDCIVQIKVDGYFDWIEKSVDIFRIINKHDMLKNRMLYYAYGMLRSGLADRYLSSWKYNEREQKQWMRVKCWPEALKELKNLDLVDQTSELIEVL